MEEQPWVVAKAEATAAPVPVLVTLKLTLSVSLLLTATAVVAEVPNAVAVAAVLHSQVRMEPAAQPVKAATAVTGKSH